MEANVTKASVFCEVKNSCRGTYSRCPFEREFDGYTEVINRLCQIMMHSTDRSTYIYSAVGIDNVELSCVEEDDAWINYGGNISSLYKDIASYDDLYGLSCENTVVFCDHLQDVGEDYTCDMEWSLRKSLNNETVSSLLVNGRVPIGELIEWECAGICGKNNSFWGNPTPAPTPPIVDVIFDYRYSSETGNSLTFNCSEQDPTVRECSITCIANGESFERCSAMKVHCPIV